jgi:hypothetical protein
MPDRYSLTIQVANPSISPGSPGHVAVALTEPSGQTYAGFGPKDTGPPWFGARSFPGKFDAHPVQSGGTLPRDFSNVLGRNSYATFTIPVSESQANAARAEIDRINKSGENYDLFDSKTCTTIANRIMQAAGLGSNLSVIPARNFEVLSDIAKTLALNPNAKTAKESGLPIPESFRGLQQDYAYVGGGYDTPSERTGHVLAGRQNGGSQSSEFDASTPAALGRQASFGERFGKWGSVPTGIVLPPASDHPELFNNRFGNWGSVPASAPSDSGFPALGTPLKDRRSTAPDGPTPTSAQGAAAATPASQPYIGDVLGKFWDSLITPAEAASPPAQGAPPLTLYFPGQGAAFADPSAYASGAASPGGYPQLRRVSSAFPGMTLPDPDQPMPPSQSGRPLGIVSGKPMPSWTVPPPLGGLLNNSRAAGNNGGFNLLAGLISRNPTPPEPPQQNADSIPERRLGRRTYSVSPASVFDTGAAAVPFVSSDDASLSGGLLGRLASPVGGAQDQSAPPDDEQEQANLQALEDRFNSTGNINDAWALYEARIASRR